MYHMNVSEILKYSLLLRLYSLRMTVLILISANCHIDDGINWSEVLNRQQRIVFTFEVETLSVKKKKKHHLKWLESY